MARERKIQAPVTLFATIETEQHEALRLIAFNERRSIAEIVREAITEVLKRHPKALEASRRIVVEEKERAAVHAE